jgi:hypothetical protein
VPCSLFFFPFFLFFSSNFDSKIATDF